MKSDFVGDTNRSFDKETQEGLSCTDFEGGESRILHSNPKIEGSGGRKTAFLPAQTSFVNDPFD